MMKYLATLHCLLLTLVAPLAIGAEPDILPARDAYRYTVSMAEGDLVVRYDIATGYYLYRDRLGFVSLTPGVTIGAPAFPAGDDHEDDYFGHQVIYRGPVTIPANVTFDGAPRDFDVELRLQGCADAGLCYPPQKWTAHVQAPAAAAAAPAAAAGESKGFSLRRMLGREALQEGDLLPADEAFRLSASSEHSDRVTLRWQIADGYYLYRDKVKVSAPDGRAQPGTPAIPGGETKHDDYFGDQVVFFDDMTAEVPVAVAAGTRDVTLEVVYQGCAEAGLCYPPIHKTVNVTLGTGAPAGAAAAPLQRSEQDRFADLIREGRLPTVVFWFFLAGLGLSLTPCVLPMVPILSGIIVGAGGDRPVTRGRAFALSVAYVLGMAVTYAVAGAAFALVGRQAQAFFQQPWLIAVFAGLFVVLALGMFGVFNFQVPAAFQSRVADLSNRQRQGTLVGTAVMGALSSLIVTACVAPPLVGALVVIGQSGDVVRGGLALFALAMGMGAPLLAVGASAGQLLPKAGPWMDGIKAAFGVMMLGVAVWMASRILPGPLTLALWAVLAFVAGWCLLTMGSRDLRRGPVVVRRGLGVIALLYGAAMLAGSLAGHSDPLRPLAGFGGGGAPAASHAVAFKRIKSVDDFERELAAAKSAGRPVMFDFYADWCVSCKEMEARTFPDPQVQAALAGAVLLQADVTANDDADQALLAKFGILGPPTIVFYGPDGVERRDARVVGFQPADEFAPHVRAAFAGGTP
ncbi:MAG: protein-disulfide reductase DsbD [Steroidobacteraceae bacterium]